MERQIEQKKQSQLDNQLGLALQDDSYKAFQQERQTVRLRTMPGFLQNWKAVFLGVLLLAAALWLFRPLSAEAAWRLDTHGYYWENSDGSYPVSTWAWLDGNEDGIAECYYFDATGYLLQNGTAPDGSTVDAGGAWTVNGIVQTRETGLQRAADGAASLQMGAIQLLPAEEFTRLVPQENGYLLENKTGSKMATVLEVDLDKDQNLKAVLDMGDKLGIAFDSPEMSKILTDAFISSFSGTYGTPDETLDRTYANGAWKQLHYGKLKSGAHEVQTDIFLHYAGRKAYCIIFAALDGQIDTDSYMRNYVK